MKRMYTHYNTEVTFHFASWSRKAFALFAALGHQVRIAVLPLSMCQNAFLKSARQGTIVNQDSSTRYLVLQSDFRLLSVRIELIQSLVGLYYLLNNKIYELKRAFSI